MERPPLREKYGETVYCFIGSEKPLLLQKQQSEGLGKHFPISAGYILISINNML